MAVDELLMEWVAEAGRPVLRVYGWSEPSVSFGYFLSLADARDAFPGSSNIDLTYVRRWTGGGIVDHRSDVTYTLAIPRGCDLALERGVESYRMIHQALANVLRKAGEQVRLAVVDEGDGGLACFTNPVVCDLTNEEGGKIAGAGQRRSRYGLLHQGSLLTGLEPSELGVMFAAELGREVDGCLPDACFIERAEALARERYDTEKWLMKR